MYKKELTLKIVFNSQGNQADAITGLKGIQKTETFIDQEY